MSTRKTEVLVGLLFLVATATFFTAETLLVGVLERPDYLVDASVETGVLTIAALLAFVDGLAIVGIAVLLFPVLKPYSERLALAYVGFRVAELAALLFYMATPLLMIGLGDRSLERTVDPSASAMRHLGALFAALHGAANTMLYLLVGVSGAILAFLLLRPRLIPRPIATLGIIGYPLMLVGTVLAMFGMTDLTRGAGTILFIPVGLFELVLPIWLFVRGFGTGVGRPSTK